MASRRPRLMGESSSGGDAASENRRELRLGGWDGQRAAPRPPEGLAGAVGGAPAPPPAIPTCRSCPS